MAVAARVVGYSNMAAVVAFIQMSSQQGRSAIFHGIKHFGLPGRYFVMSPEGVTILTEDITHLGR
jgi:hypothetical protein